MNTAPVGRKEVNVTVTDEDGDVIRRAIQAEVARQGQVFVVVPFVRDVAPTHERYVLFYDYAYLNSLCSAILPHCSLTQLRCPSLLYNNLYFNIYENVIYLTILRLNVTYSPTDFDPVSPPTD
jgi:hypothetical protein